MDILDDMGVSKLSAKVFSKVNYSFKELNLIVKCHQKKKRNFRCCSLIIFMKLICQMLLVFLTFRFLTQIPYFFGFVCFGQFY